MTKRPGLTLLEVLLAAALLAMVVAACLPLLTSVPPLVPLRPDPQLRRLAEATPTILPPNASIERFDSTVGNEIRGAWVVIVSGDRSSLVWIPQDLGVTETMP